MKRGEMIVRYISVQKKKKIFIQMFEIRVHSLKRTIVVCYFLFVL